MLYCAVTVLLCCAAVFYCAVLYCPALCCTVLCCAVSLCCFHVHSPLSLPFHRSRKPPCNRWQTVAHHSPTQHTTPYDITAQHSTQQHSTVYHRYVRHAQSGGTVGKNRAVHNKSMRSCQHQNSQVEMDRQKGKELP
jgi:hypothetical protein